MGWVRGGCRGGEGGGPGVCAGGQGLGVLDCVRASAKTAPLPPLTRLAIHPPRKDTLPISSAHTRSASAPPGILQFEVRPSRRMSMSACCRAPQAQLAPGRPGREMAPTVPRASMEM